jgi:hypothetical protein
MLREIIHGASLDLHPSRCCDMSQNINGLKQQMIKGNGRKKSVK